MLTLERYTCLDSCPAAPSGQNLHHGNHDVYTPAACLRPLELREVDGRVIGAIENGRVIGAVENVHGFGRFGFAPEEFQPVGCVQCARQILIRMMHGQAALFLSSLV